MKIQAIAIATLMFLAIVAEASEPYDSYVRTLIQGGGDDVWFVFPKEIEGQTITPPKGGYLFKITLDLDGDGVEEVFVTNNDQVVKSGANWTLYYRGASANYSKINSEVWLNGSLWVKSEGNIKKYSSLAPQTAKTFESINTWWIDAAGKYQTSTRQLNQLQSTAINGGDPALLGTNGLPDENKVAQYLQIGAPIILNIQKVLLGKFYQNANTPWRPVSSTFSLAQQYLDPADAADIASLATWTPPANP